MSERSQAILSREEQAQSRAAQQLIEAVGGVLPASQSGHKSEAQLSKYARPNYAESMPINVVEALEAITHGKHGHPHVTRYLANRAGYALVKLPETAARNGDILHLLAQHSKEGGDIASAICEALNNGNKIFPHECPAIRKEIWELIRVAITIDAELDFIERDGA